MKLVPKIRKRKGLGALSLIIAMFLGSALIRVAIGADGAIAEALNGVDFAAEARATETAYSATGERERLAALLKKLQEKEADLTVREQQQNTRQMVLDTASKDVQERLAQLEQAEEELRATIALADGAAEDDLSRLTTVYESMKSKDAAALFEAMEPEFASGFLGRMRPDAAANIMAGLTPGFAYTISVILAGRNANVPKS